MATTKSNGKGIASSGAGDDDGRKGPDRRLGDSQFIDANDSDVMMFSDITYGPQEASIRFRLLHFWEARVPVKKTLLGVEMLIIDEQGTVMKGFISPGKMEKFCPQLRKGGVYILVNFFGSRTKPEYRVAAHDMTVSFSLHSQLSNIVDSPIVFPDENFRFYTYEDFKANCDSKGDLCDVIGHLKLVNGQSLDARPVIDGTEVANCRRMVVHLQPHEGPVMKLSLWDDAALEFCQKFLSCEKTPSVVLVTTVNPKTFQGTMSLNSMSSSRVFLDSEVEPTRDYLTWLGANPDVLNQVNPDVVTKRETATISEIFTYMRQDGAQPAYFECMVTVEDVVHGAAWYYIGCGGCKTKATRGATSLMCGKCKKNDIAGEAQYLAKLAVYDKSEEAVFVILGEAGAELTGKPASELVRNYYEDNGAMEAGTVVPVPQALLSTIGKTYNFSVKVSDRNLSGQSSSLTVTKVLPMPAPSAEAPSPSEDDVGVILEDTESSAKGGNNKIGDSNGSGSNKRLKIGN